MTHGFLAPPASLAAPGAGDLLSVYARPILLQMMTSDAFIGGLKTLGELESGVTAGRLGGVQAVVLPGSLSDGDGPIGLLPERRLRNALAWMCGALHHRRRREAGTKMVQHFCEPERYRKSPRSCSPE